MLSRETTFFDPINRRDGPRTVEERLPFKEYFCARARARMCVCVCVWGWGMEMMMLLHLKYLNVVNLSLTIPNV